ncbi:MAG: exo-alpha-sialidase [Bacteroidales bacterium]|nr:exo-alpha-sialidase [Bacteroidales bacterium]MCF8455862.1 exo-alpha-sialidase [Bacteroidales bacterium]
MSMTKYLQISILVLHLSLIIRLSAVSQSQAYLINATDSILKCNNSVVELKANHETLYAIPNISPVSESLVGPDHTASGFVVTLSTGTLVNLFRLDPGYYGNHAGNNSMIVKRTSIDGGLTWTTPELVYNDIQYDDRNVYGGKLGQDTIILFFRKYDAYTYLEIGLYYIYSPDGGLTWSPLQYFNFTPNTCFGSQQVIPIPGRGYMMAIYASYYVELRFSHDGLSWDSIQYSWDYRVSQTFFLTEIQFTYCGNGRIIGFARNQNGSYGDTFYQMVSEDYGYTWTQPTLTNIAAPFPCPAPSSFYDEANDDFWFIATDRRHYAGPTYSAYESRVWLYKNKPSEIIHTPTNYTLFTSFLRPFPNAHMFYGYPIYTKKMDGNYLILFTESKKKSNYFEDADYYQFTISYDTISVKADHYLWSTGSSDSTILVSNSGIYKLTLADSYGAEFIDSVFVNMLDFDLNQSTFSFIPGDTINPQITLNTPNESTEFNWSTGDTALSVLLYPQITETIYITGSNAFQTCTDSITLFAIYVPLQMGTAATVVDVSCFGGNNGAIIPSYFGGAYPLIFNWSHGASTAQATNLTAGSYSVIISDVYGDSIIENYTILEPTGIEIQSTKYDVSSIGENDGAIFLSVSGGVSPYTCTWSNGSTSLEIYYVPAGAYSITISEANGCETYASFTIYEPELISAQTIQINQGWSMISSYINPSNPTCEDFFSPIVSSIIIVKNHLGYVYWPLFNVNQIGEVQLGKGYLIKLAQSDSLLISGTIAVPENTSIYCPSGWNIIGYLRNNPGEVSNMLSSLAGNIILLKNSGVHSQNMTIMQPLLVLYS